MKSLIHRIHRKKNVLTPRQSQLLDLLRQEPLTIQQLSERLHITVKTVRNQLSHVAKVVQVEGEGPWGHTRYFVEREETP